MRSLFACRAALLTTVLTALVAFPLGRAETGNTSLTEHWAQTTAQASEAPTDTVEGLRQELEQLKQAMQAIQQQLQQLETKPPAQTEAAPAQPKTSPPRIAAPPRGEGTIPRLVSTYTGTIHNTTVNRQATLALTSIVENQGNISGKLIIGPGLSGSGPFSGTIRPDGSVIFTTDRRGPIFFTGSLRTDGSLSGTYRTSRNQEGTWHTTPATQAEGVQTSGSGEIPVAQRFFGEFEGTAENTTLRRKGSMAVIIEPSDRGGQVQILTRHWDGLGGEGTLIGEISADGKLRASGKLAYTTTLGGTSTWHYDLTGTISDNRLIGDYILKPPFESHGRPAYIWQQFEIKDKKRPPLKTQKGHFDLEKSERAYTPRQD